MKLFARKNRFSIFLLLLAYTTFAQEDRSLIEQPSIDTTKRSNAVVCYNGCETAKNDYFSIICSKKKIIQFLASKLELPQTVEEGIVRLQLDFDPQGKLVNLAILEAVNEESGQAVLAAAQTIPDLLPSMAEQATEIFSYKVFISITSDLTYYDELIKTPVSDHPFEGLSDFPEDISEMPRFPGCEAEEKAVRKVCADKEMLKFIYGNIIYPEVARKNGVEGTVVIRFMVDSDGEVVYPQVVKDVGAGCGTEALRVARSMPLWIAGTTGLQEKVPIFFNLPVRFRLEKKRRGRSKRKKRRF